MTTSIIITGAGTGIGRALAIKLVDSGYPVIGIGRRLAPLQELQKHNPTKINIIQADVAQPEERTKITATIAKLNCMCYLVHNAAIAEPLSLLKDIKLQDWQHQQAINVEAPLFLTQQLLPYLKNGRVLHISSGLAHYTCPGAAAYCMSKAALYMLYLSLREELKEFNIAVGSAIPGVVDTPMQSGLRSTSKDQLPVVDSFIRFKEKDEMIAPEIVADFLKWLLCEINAEEFSQQEWNISDNIHHSKWLKNSNIQWAWSL
jgi:benzil reductase ((S)-benzoin forming)